MTEKRKPGWNRAGRTARQNYLTKPRTQNQKRLRIRALEVIEAAYELDAVQNEIFELSKGGIGGFR